MSETCQAQRDLMVEYVLGELEGLVATRLEAHLDNCADCARVYARLSRGFSEARTLEPTVDPEDLDRWAGRLGPYLEPAPRPPRFGRGLGFSVWAVSGAAIAAGLIAVWVLPSQEELPMEAPVIAKTMPEAPPAKMPDAVVQKVLSPHLKSVVSEDWNGSVRAVSPEVTEVSMDTGFAVMDFEGGEGRQLRIVAPDVEVRVLGTRFFVEAHAGVATTIGVVSGRVEVRSRDQVEVLGPGQVRSFDETGAHTPDRARIRSADHHQDLFLAREARPAPASKPTAARPRRARPDPVVALTAAERLVREGRVDEGLKAYGALIRGRAPVQIRSLARYERARVWGFVQGDLQRAETEFDRLVAQAGPEVRRQAALARCELALEQQRCAASACLRALRADADADLRREAQALLRKWDVMDDTCRDHKSGEAHQPTK